MGLPLLLASTSRILLNYSCMKSFSVLSPINSVKSSPAKVTTIFRQTRHFHIRSLLHHRRTQGTFQKLENREQEIISRAIKGRLGLSPRLHDNKQYHQGDGLKVTDWTLIYNNSGTMWLLIICGIYSVVSYVCIITAVDELAERRKQFRKSGQSPAFTDIVTRKAGVCLTFGLALLATLARYRRCWVVRIYEKNMPHQSKRPAPIVIPAGSPPPKTPPPIREYCIVWANFLFRRRLYLYSSKETARARESSAFVTNLFGNFTARKRSWAVFQHYFDDALDYYRVRGKTVAGAKFVA